MRKNLYFLGLALTATIGFTAISARADEQVNTQVTNQSAGAVGNGNSIFQQSDQVSVQQQKRAGSGSSGGTLQDSLQQTDQSAAAVGNDNYVEQRASQMNIQQNEHRHSRYRRY